MNAYSNELQYTKILTSKLRGFDSCQILTYKFLKVNKISMLQFLYHSYLSGADKCERNRNVQVTQLTNQYLSVKLRHLKTARGGNKSTKHLI